MSKQVQLVSERLLYKPVDSSYNTQTYLSWLNDEEVIRYLEVIAPYTQSDLQQYLHKTEINEQLHFWAIHLRENDKHIGNIKIDPVNYRHGIAEYGIMMGDKSKWSKGYAKEASEVVIRFCFEQLAIRKLTLGVVEDNTPAVQLYSRLGFITEGVLKDHGFYGGKLCNMVRMALFNPAQQNT